MFVSNGFADLNVYDIITFRAKIHTKILGRASFDMRTRAKCFAEWAEFNPFELLIFSSFQNNEYPKENSKSLNISKAYKISIYSFRQSFEQFDS